MSDERKISFTLFENELRQLANAPDDICCHVFKALAMARLGEEIPPLSETERIIYNLILSQVMRAAQTSENRRGNAKKRISAEESGNKAEQTETNKNKPEQISRTDTVTDTVTLTDTYTDTGTNPPCPQKGECGEGFEKFWEIYPKKSGRQNAKKAWDKLCPDEELRKTIFEALKKQKKLPQWNKENGQYIPYPAKWLEEKRWEDEPGGSASDETPHFDIEKILEFSKNNIIKLKPDDPRADRT